VPTHGPATAVNVLQLGAVYVVGKIVSPVTAENKALTVQLLPLEHKFGKVKLVALLNGGLKINEPPQELVTVKVPVEGGFSEYTVPVKSNSPDPRHGPGVAETVLQLVAPAPAVPAFV
jgi:hypothetical protein